MSELLAEPRKQLALNTDWRPAVGMVALFVICALVAAGELFPIVRGAQPQIDVTWQSWMLLAVLVSWFGWGRERLFRIASLIGALSVASRILLHLLKATVETQFANAALLRIIDLMLCVGGCVGVSWWFKSKIRYV